MEEGRQHHSTKRKAAQPKRRKEKAAGKLRHTERRREDSSAPPKRWRRVGLAFFLGVGVAHAGRPPDPKREGQGGGERQPDPPQKRRWKKQHVRCFARHGRRRLPLASHGRLTITFDHATLKALACDHYVRRPEVNKLQGLFPKGFCHATLDVRPCGVLLIQQKRTLRRQRHAPPCTPTFDQ